MMGSRQYGRDNVAFDATARCDLMLAYSVPSAHILRPAATSLLRTISSHSSSPASPIAYTTNPAKAWIQICTYISFLRYFPVVAERRSRAKNITIKGRVVARPCVFLRLDLFPDIELRTQAKDKNGGANQYHIEFSVGDTLWSTKKAKGGNKRTSWNETFDFVLWVPMHCSTPSN